jgi:murein DD-endopeptidase MepM/ murein hydrolase activator NlpD
MLSHRTTPRGFLSGAIAIAAAAALLALAAAAAPAGAAPQHERARKAAAATGVPRLVFPVAGPVEFTDDFGDARARWAHPGNDIVAPKRALALAAEAGTVRFYTRSASAGCMLYLYGDSGTAYQYIHLNNDAGAGNDNRGGCVGGVAWPATLRDGQRVTAGQLIGFVGDSGDADGGRSHLHFEVRPGGGRPVSPYPYLLAATRATAPGGLAAALSVR